MEEFELLVGRNLNFKLPAMDPPSPTINATQRRINELMGISDEDFLKYACKSPGPESMEIADEDRRKINELMGVTDEDILKYVCKAPGPESTEIIDEDRRKINQMMGVTDEDILKYS